jgi:hypothetical protein
VGIGGVVERKEESSFSEEKEAKRLLFFGQLKLTWKPPT